MQTSMRLGLGTLLGLTVISASADIAYNNFGPGDTFDQQAEWPDSQGGYLAMPFTSAATGQVASIAFVLSGNSNYNAYLELADHGLNQGTVIETWSDFGGTLQPQTLAGDGSASLTAGTNYWLEVDCLPGAGHDGGWSLNSTGATGTFLYNNSNFGRGSENGTLGVFRVETTPEPASLAVIGLGLLAIGIRRRKVRRS